MRHSADRHYLAAGLVCLVMLLGLAWFIGHRSVAESPTRARSLDAVRLGPESGQPVAGYLAGLPARWPAPDAGPVPALVQFTTGLDVAAAASVLTGTGPAASRAGGADPAGPPAGGADAAGAGPVGPPAGGAGAGSADAGGTPRTAVFRVPVPRVQTALRFQPLAPVTDADPLTATTRRLTLARAAAQRAAAADAARLSGRPARVAAAEAAALARPDCRCVLAVLVSGDRGALDSLAARSAVRAVDAAPAGTPDDGVALAPLLPEQTRAAAPPPDDGAVPPG